MAGVLFLFVISFLFKITTAHIFRTMNEYGINPQIPQYGVIQNPHVATNYLQPIYEGKYEKTAKFCPKTEQNLDNEVLNNVALALQFLLVKNFLNKPIKTRGSDETELPSVALESTYCYPSKTNPYGAVTKMPNQFDQNYIQMSNPAQFSYGYPPCLAVDSQKSMPNANFIGTSNFVDNSMLIPGVDLSSIPKRSYNIISPYDVVGSNPDFGMAKVNYDAAFAPYLTEQKDYGFGLF